MLPKLFLAIGAGAGFLGVALGAFGAHVLKDRMTADMMTVYQTGVQYHLVHAVALIVVAVAAVHWPGSTTTVAGWLFLAGIILFSGSLYAMAFTGIRALGAITPVGGLCFLGGWGCLFVSALRG